MRGAAGAILVSAGVLLGNQTVLGIILEYVCDVIGACDHHVRSISELL